MLWVEQPVGTGFSQGTPNVENEDQVAEQLVGFMQQFLEVFSELKGKKLWLTGESVSLSTSLFFVWDAQLRDRILASMRALMFLVSCMNESD